MIFLSFIAFSLYFGLNLSILLLSITWNLFHFIEFSRNLQGKNVWTHFSLYIFEWQIWRFLSGKKSPLSTQDKMRFRHFISASSFIWESCFWLILMIVFSNFLRRRRQKNVFPSSYHLEYMMAHCAIIYPLQLNWKKSNFLAFLGWAKAIILPSKTSTHMLINWSKRRNTFQTLFWNDQYLTKYPLHSFRNIVLEIGVNNQLTITSAENVNKQLKSRKSAENVIKQLNISLIFEILNRYLIKLLRNFLSYKIQIWSYLVLSIIQGQHTVAVSIFCLDVSRSWRG